MSKSLYGREFLGINLPRTLRIGSTVFDFKDAGFSYDPEGHARLHTMELTWEMATPASNVSITMELPTKSSRSEDNLNQLTTAITALQECLESLQSVIVLAVI